MQPNNNLIKIAVITRHAITNYGSLLQAYALQSVFEKANAKCEIINYIRYDERGTNIANTLLKKSPKWNINQLTRFVYKTIQAPEYVFSQHRFEKERNKYLNQSNTLFGNSTELKQNCPKADIYCTGSDQVWGEIGTEPFDENYFLSFAPEGAKRVAYAASFGKTEFNPQISEAIKNFLNKYDLISVREKSAVEILQKENINAVQVLDPTLLLTGDEWSKLIKSNKTGNYVLLYQLHSNDEMDRYAKKFAKKAGMKLIRLTPLLHRTVKGGTPVYLPTVATFLSYVKNANYMITDSFHGTAFAINFNTEFIEILPSKTRTRNQNILELTDLKNRILKNYNDFHFINEKTNFETANKLLQAERKKSFDFINKIINI